VFGRGEAPPFKCVLVMVKNEVTDPWGDVIKKTFKKEERLKGGKNARGKSSPNRYS